ncbi:MAG: tRNA (adenosine(37)-N6)-threonylcarbamoyltransferase complex ATPase subunit type 1 TsaE [Verrucomicrobia bacterium]|nr:tRNA (adenosine(37)-N6)-threonylcarbamoyltransferase complex ATPase subunit type 1 TsaE [Verrucomicrobiota bacterium]
MNDFNPVDLLEKLRSGMECKTAEHTERLGYALAQQLPADTWLALRGDLGAGKTTLVRGTAKALGITSAITSPTYTIFNLYQGSRQLMHMDAYRLENAHGMDALMVEEFLSSPYLAIVEWPDRIADWLPSNTVWLDITIQADGVSRSVRRVSLPC